MSASPTGPVASPSSGAAASVEPARARAVLLALILVAAVENLNLSVANAARSAFLQGDQWAYLAGLAAVLIGAALVFFLFPKKEREHELREEYLAEDQAAASRS